MEGEPGAQEIAQNLQRGGDPLLDNRLCCPLQLPGLGGSHWRVGRDAKLPLTARGRPCLGSPRNSRLGHPPVTGAKAKDQAPLWSSTHPGSQAYLLCPAFISSLILVVNPAEVGDDHGDRQGNDQDATQGADGPEDLPGDRLGHHVSIPEGEAEAGVRDRGHVGDKSDSPAFHSLTHSLTHSLNNCLGSPTCVRYCDKNWEGTEQTRSSVRGAHVLQGEDLWLLL